MIRERDRRPFWFGDRFEIREELFRDQGITTYRGRDAHTGQSVIIKAAPSELLGPGGLARLDYEIAILNTHADGDGRLHLGRERDLVFCAREFLVGETLAERTRARALPVGDVLALGIAILGTLARVHPHGVRHRDIKPANIILRDGRPERATLVDFALGRYRLAGDPRSAAAAQAAMYSAPEQVGLIGAAIGAGADLYSVGVALYEALAGRAPFRAGTVGELLRIRATERPPPLRDLVPGIPRALEAIIDKLLLPDPRDRYHTARGALADLERLQEGLGAGEGDPAVPIGETDARPTITEPVFVGRRDELAIGERAVEGARHGSGGLILLEGESGSGKTWFLAELARIAGARGARVLTGHALDRVAQRPYQVLDEIAGSLVARISIDREWGSLISARLGALGGAACEALPALSSVVEHDSPATDLGPEEHGEARTTRALATLLDALGCTERPALVLLDDAQWLDDSSMRLFERWQEAPLDGARHVIVVLAFRPEDVADDHPLRDLTPLARVSLPPLGDEDVRRQIASMAGPLPHDAVEAVVQQAGGNPFLVSALVYGMVETGALEQSASGWNVSLAQLGDLQAADRAAAIVTARLRALPKPARRLLSVAALLGRTFDPALAGELAGTPARDAFATAEALRGTILLSDESGASFTFVHDRLREALLSEHPAAERRRLHRRAAEALEVSAPERAFDLAYHFAEAGDLAKALPFALAAAEAARARFALDLADSYYRIAERGAAEAPVDVRLAVARGLGDVLSLRSRHGEAARHYERALDLADTDRERAEISQRFSFLELKRGDMEAACYRGEAALRLLGHRVPKHRLVLGAWTLLEVLIQTLHTLFPSLFLRPRRGGEDADELFAIDIYHALNGPYFFSRGLMWAGWAHLRLINLAERHPGTRAQGRAYAAHAVLFNAFPRLFERGLRLSRRGAEICEAHGDLWGQAQGLTFHALMLFNLGRFEETIDVGREASELFDRTGDRWEANTGLDFAVDALVRMGDLRGAVAQAEEIWRRGLEIGDSHAMAWSLDAWSRATDGRVPKKLLDAARDRARDLQTAVAVDQADGVRLIHEGDLDAAVEVLERARDLVDREGFFYELNTPVLTYLAQALRLRAEAVSAYASAERKKRLARARKAARRAVRVARSFRFNLPHALREAALIEAMRGRPARARKDIEESVEVASTIGLRYEHAQSRLARAELGAALGWTDAAKELEAAREDVEAMRGRAIIAGEESGDRRRVTLSLIDRFDAILEIGRTLATALSREEIYAQAYRAALKLLRAQRCIVIECPARNGDARPRPVYGDVGMPYSEELVDRTFAAGRSQTLSAAQAQADLAAHRAGIRSILCIPIWARSEPHACLYVTHADVADLFADDDRRIGDFLGTLTGAAIENADGFLELQRLSSELEQRVRERTRELANANRELEESLYTVKKTQEQLLQAQKMAALGTLIAGLSHELNNPLGVVLGNVQILLRQTPEDSPAHKPLVAIERQALRCSRLIRALLDFSRTRRRERAPTRPEAIVRAVLEFVEPEARTRDRPIVERTPREPLPEIDVSAQEIESALINVLSNAIDASPPGESVAIAVQPEARAGVEGVVFLVADQGPGIPEEIRDQIFDPFFTTKPVGRGTGLGLSITSQVIRNHGGAIDIDSEEGGGTTFRLWLPIGGGLGEKAPETPPAISPDRPQSGPT